MKALAAADLESLGGRVYELKGSQPLVLDDPETVWVVQSGALAVFSTEIKEGIAGGVRRLLFKCGIGRAVFGMPIASGPIRSGLIAVAVEKSSVRKVPVQRLAEVLGEGSEAAQGLIEAWITRIGQFMSGAPIRASAVVTMARQMLVKELPQAPVKVSSNQELGLQAGQVVMPERETCVWVLLKSGRASLMGLTPISFPAGATLIPLGPDMWLSAVSDVDLCTWATPNLREHRFLKNGLDCLHGILGSYLELLSEQDESEERERLKQSARFEDLRIDAAMEDLSAVLNPRERFDLRDTPLVTAAGIVGQALGIRIRPPAASEDMSRVRDHVEAIARASRVRVRKVLLRGRWWSKDCGPMVAYLGENERRPIALLPRGAGYDVVDSMDRVRKPLTPAIQNELRPEAYAFYRSLPDRLGGVRDVFRFSLHGRLPDLIWITLSGLAVTLLGMLVPEATGQLMDKAIPGADRRMLLDLALVLAAAALGSALFSLFQGIVTVRMGTIAEMTSQGAMWDRLLKFGPTFFRRFSSGDLQQRVNAVSEISRELNAATIRPLFSGFMALLNLLLLFYYSADLAVIAVLAAVVVLVLTSTIGFQVRKKAVQLNEMVGSFFGMVIQMIGGVGRIRVAGAEYRSFNYWVGRYTRQMTMMLGIQRLKDFASTFNNALPALASAALYWKGAGLVSGVPGESTITIGGFLASSAAFGLFLSGAIDVSDTLVRILDTVTKGKRIQPLLDGEPEVKDDAADPGRLKGGLRIESVVFRYKPDGPVILDGVSIQVEPGEFVAFVGPSGSGKSTILRIILGFERPESGRVLFDGQDLSGLDVLAVRRQLGVVLQNGRLNAGSVFDNIANNAALTYDEAWEASADAAFADDLKEMPMGMHTVVSEGGTNFSGGQRQRLLIARALAVRPKMVLFDEATSALDNRTQAVVSEAMERRKVTRFVIAHRLSTIINADRIYVLERGRIIQQGTYEELSRQDGVFRDLVARQTA